MIQAHRTVHLMGTIITLMIEHEAPEPLLEQAVQKLERYERQFSANDPHSDLMRINHAAGRKAVAVDPELYALIQRGKVESLRVKSGLNIAIGPIVQAWRIGFHDARVPAANELVALKSLTDPNNICLDEIHGTVYLSEPGMALDLGALAKGYFADQLRQYFEAQGVHSGLINLGGNLLMFGQCPYRSEGWRIGIQDPQAERNAYGLTLHLPQGSVVTSGIYERHLQAQGKDYHHILDRQTGYPMETEIASLTIISKTSLEGEIYTTQLFGQTVVQALAELEQLPNVEGVVITRHKAIHYTTGIQQYLHNERK